MLSITSSQHFENGLTKQPFNEDVYKMPKPTPPHPKPLIVRFFGATDLGCFHVIFSPVQRVIEMSKNAFDVSKSAHSCDSHLPFPIARELCVHNNYANALRKRLQTNLWTLDCDGVSIVSVSLVMSWLKAIGVQLKSNLTKPKFNSFDSLADIQQTISFTRLQNR